MWSRRHQRILSGRERAWLLGIAIGAVWITHGLAYLLASPDPHERTLLLSVTGHGYLSYVGPIVVSVMIASVVGFVLHRTTGWAASSMPVHFVAVAGRLALVQVLTFAGLEVTERLLHGTPLSDLADPAVGIGLVLQLVTAFIGALLLFALVRAAEAIARSIAPDRVEGDLSIPGLSLVEIVRRLNPATGGSSPRAPPSA